MDATVLGNIFCRGGRDVSTTFESGNDGGSLLEANITSRPGSIS